MITGLFHEYLQSENSSKLHEFLKMDLCLEFDF